MSKQPKPYSGGRGVRVVTLEVISKLVIKIFILINYNVFIRYLTCDKNYLNVIQKYLFKKKTSHWI